MSETEINQRFFRVWLAITLIFIILLALQLK